MKKLLLSLALVASTVTPAMAQQNVNTIIDVARGNGTDLEVTKARIEICREVAKDMRPETVENAVSWMRANRFTEDAINKTQLVCISYFQGMIDMRNAQLNRTTY